MLKLYCQKCGALNAYVSEKPNFCQKCAYAFGPSLSKAGASSLEEDEDEENVDLPQLDGLEIEIDPGRSNAMTVGNLAGTANPNQKNDIKPIDQQYTTEDFQREAGSIKGPAPNKKNEET